MLKLYVVEKQNFMMARVINDRSCLTLLHSKRGPKLYGVLAFLSAIGLRKFPFLHLLL